MQSLVKLGMEYTNYGNLMHQVSEVVDLDGNGDDGFMPTISLHVFKCLQKGVFWWENC